MWDKTLGCPGWLVVPWLLLAAACGGARPSPYTAPSTNWCERQRGGAPGTAPLVELGRAAAANRFFGAEVDYQTSDLALASALDGPAMPLTALDGAGWRSVLLAYAGALTATCAVAPEPSELPAARVELRGKVAVVHPGAGAIVIPDAARAVALDLRGVPARADMAPLLDAAASALMTSPLPRPVRVVRHVVGVDDEVYAPMHGGYLNEVAEQPRDAIPGSAARELPIAVLTDGKLAPDAAELAGALRLANRAWLFGEDVIAGVAESRFFPVGDAGLTFRQADLYAGAARWPDTIVADFGQASADDFVASLPTLGPIGQASMSGSTRPELHAVTALVGPHPGAVGMAPSRGEARAALLLASGTLRHFFPYFATVGDHLDERLLETLATVDAAPLPLGRLFVTRVLRRLGEVISDGHNFVRDQYPTVPAGYLPVVFDNVGSEAVIRRSASTELHPGDVITSVDGVAAADWLSTELARTSAATPGYKFRVAVQRLLALDGPRTFGLRDPTGAERSVTVMPQPYETLTALGFADSERPCGFLDDLGAPTVYYLNVDEMVTTRVADWSAAIAAATDGHATSMIVDMRGYPGANAYALSSLLITTAYDSPAFIQTDYLGLDVRTTFDEGFMLPATASAFAAPIVLLTGPGAVSQAENFAMTLSDHGRLLHVVGRTSAGTDGEITGIQLPGGYSFTFTGMEVRHHDGAVFHGVGIVPDIVVSPTAADFAAGSDPELTAAVAAAPK